MPNNKNKKSSEQPEVVKLTKAQADELKQRVLNSRLSDKDKKLITGLISFSLWLQIKLCRSQLTLLRLKKFFGFKTEKVKAKQPADEEAGASSGNASDSDHENSPSENHSASSSNTKNWDDAANHGRHGAEDYTGCVHRTIHHAALKAGDPCPICEEAGQSGKLYEIPAGNLIRLEGSALVTGHRYEIEKLRCTLCGTVFQADVPDSLNDAPKYSASAVSGIAMGRYGAGVPFKRREMLQASQGVPLPDSTQWDLTYGVLYPVLTPIVGVLTCLSSEGEQNYYDDAPNRILEATQAIHTTAMVTTYDGHEIHLFLTGPGCGLTKVFPILSEHVNRFITMSDAASANYRKRVEETLAARWILCLCLMHARRNFHDVLALFPEICHEIIKAIGQVYYHDKICRQRHYDDQQRLRYHQQHSKPILDALYVWMTNQYQYPKQYRAIEPNSGLGEAISYMIRHWRALTRFLTVPGAPLDNSMCERTIKFLIRHRKNSLFYRTDKGALVGDACMTVIQTCLRNHVNPMDYLTVLQQQHLAVIANPHDWLPWNYQTTLANMAS